ncbi:MAG: hypothetical protein ABIG96_04995 [Candidatus Micrarchaeota archaeon]
MGYTVWLEIIRVMLGVLILLALSTLFRVFKDTKVVNELKIVTLGFALYTLQAFLGALQAYGYAMPVIWKLELDEFMEASMYVVFVYAIVRLNSLFNLLQLEKRVVKVMKEVLG